MKLLYITNGINGAGGLERVLSIKASFLADQYNYEVIILSINENHLTPFYEFSDRIKMINISVSGNPLLYIYSYSKGIKNILNEINPDVISVCDDGLKGFFIPYIINNKFPIIYERHASIVLNTKNGFIGKIVAYLMQRKSVNFDRFVVLTNANRTEWLRKKAVVIPNPLSLYPSDTASVVNKKVIVVGSHSHNKGYDLLLLVWEKVIGYYPDWQLHIYGKIDNDKTYLHIAENLALDTSVFFHDTVSNIEEKYLESSLLVMSSRSEGFGMVLIEAMACGVPCIAFDCPSGPRDIITNEVDGFLISPGNIEEMAAKVIMLLENQSLREQMGSRARENVKRFTTEKIMSHWDSLFKELI